MSQAIHTSMSTLKRVLNQNDQLQVHLRTQQETSHTSASTVGRVSIRIASYRCTSGYIGDKNMVTMDIVEVSRRFPFISTIIPPTWLYRDPLPNSIETLYLTPMWVGIYTVST